MNCECQHWARDGAPPLTEHHPRCPHYNPTAEALALINDMLKGMEVWGADTDGIHYKAWEPYKRGLLFTGQLQKHAKLKP